MDHAVRFGGCLTVNWHDRSVAPERLWGACYRELVQELKGRGAWFATAQSGDCVVSEAPIGQVRNGFQVRREGYALVFAGGQDDGLPGLQLRIHRGKASGRALHGPQPDSLRSWQMSTQNPESANHQNGFAPSPECEPAIHHRSRRAHPGDRGGGIHWLARCAEFGGSRVSQPRLLCQAIQRSR